MAIFVTGMHRSGTSMVASILHALGVNLGPDGEMVPANKFNEAGYFENAPAVAVNDAFLRKNDLSWRTLPTLETKAALAGVEELTAAISQIVKSLGARNPWCLKDPRLSFLLPYWTLATTSASAIVCIRRPDAVALSLKMRNDLSISYGAALWELYTVAALRNTSQMPRAIVIYEELLANPKQVIDGLIAALPELADLKLGADAIKAAVSRVRGDLDHSAPVNSKALPPTALDLYQRLAKGDFDVSKQEPGIASEMVRLEAGHQASKRMNSEARERLAQANDQLAAEKARLARQMALVSDIAQLIAEPGQPAPTDPDSQIDRIRQFVRARSPLAPGTTGTMRDRHDRVEWPAYGSGDPGARMRTILDRSEELQRDIARLRAGNEHHAVATAHSHNAITKLAAEAQRLNVSLAMAEKERASLAQERAQARCEYETILTKLNAERDMVAKTMESLRARIEDGSANAGIQQSSGARDALLADLSRATDMLDQRNREVAALGVREQDLMQRAHKLDADIERLQRDLQLLRRGEADVASPGTSYDQSDRVLRAALGRERATAEIQAQLSSARETIEALERQLDLRGKRVDELEAQQADSQSLLLEYEVRIPILEEAAVERVQLSARNAELKEEIQRITTARDKSFEKYETAMAALDARIADLNKQNAQSVSETQAALTRKEEAIARAQATIAERDAAIAGLKKALNEAALAPQKADDGGRTHALEQQVASFTKQMSEMASDLAASRAEAADSRRLVAELRSALDTASAGGATQGEAMLELEQARQEALDLKAQLAAAKTAAATVANDERRLREEIAELTRALKSARDQADQTRADQLAKGQQPASPRTTPANDLRLRRQLLVLHELLAAIDTLLSPKYGRLTIPVRQIRVRLTQARQVVDGEVAMTRR